MASIHPAIARGSVAVISGGASGIGLAAAKLWAKNGLSVVIADVDQNALSLAREEIQSAAADAKAVILAEHTDVSKKAEVEKLKEKVISTFPQSNITVLQANAGLGGPTRASSDEGWDRIFGVNFYGVQNMVTAFTPLLQKHGEPALIISTGSKQGITTPPGSGAAYNVSKAAVKVFTEQLAHELRQDKTSKIDVKLLIPGWVHTGLTGAKEGKPKPDGAWTPEETVDFLAKSIQKGSFYVLCPDNETPRDVDLARMEWNIRDIIEDRPALSRWHDEFAPKFSDYMKQKGLA
ncbi:hypothetical protein OC846_004009 [Tilletia horrida]|uniref:Oxidoreductase n=1 Tax=Tilletia horrida TaxID=155126 RepID=A0AAN6GQG8_9BASI|nr:hypothetical protein OC845_005949 [Tilletia horrida]KAK0549590.1 hypothetical protein OC846_004009 [Tilletia horrida]KAK0564249.1 hypothetical protein OC861_004397 [Tilletia horrida]